MKTKMKNRIISAVLALTMVASLLPAGLITPPAQAATVTTAGFNTNGGVKGASGGFTITHSGTAGGNLGNHIFVLLPDVTTGSTVPSVAAGTSAIRGGYAAPTQLITDLTSRAGAPDPSSYYVKTGSSNDKFDSSGLMTFSGSMGLTFEQARKALADGGYKKQGGTPITESDNTIPMVAMIWTGTAGSYIRLTTMDWDGSELVLKKQDDISTQMTGTTAAAGAINETVGVDASGGNGTLVSLSFVIKDLTGNDRRNDFKVTLTAPDGSTATSFTKDTTYTVTVTNTASIASNQGPYSGEVVITYKAEGVEKPKTERISVDIAPASNTATTISYSTINIRVRKGDPSKGVPAALLSVTGGDPTCTWAVVMRKTIKPQAMGIRPEAMYTATGTAGLVGTYISLNGPVTTSGTPTRIAQAKHNNVANTNTTAAWETAMPKDGNGKVIVDMEASPDTLGTTSNVNLLPALDSLAVGTYSDTIELNYFTVQSAAGPANVTAAPTPPTTEATTNIKIAQVPVIIEVIDADSAIFQGNGGTWTEDSNTLFVKTVTIANANPGGNRSVSKPADPTLPGYKFLGWAKQGDTTIINTWPQTGVANGQVYVAQWQEDIQNWTVSFNMNGGGSPKPADQTVTNGGKASEPTTEPTRSGYAFKGWYKEPACTNAWDFDNDTVTKDTTLYAKWVNVYTVTFDSQGGSAVSPITGVESGSKITAPTAPTRNDYTFGGWYKESGCTNAWNFTSDTVTKDTTLYAKWDKKTYTATINVKKDGQAYSPDKVYLKKSGTAVNASGTSITSGTATITGVPSDTYDIFIGSTDTNVDITINGANNSATVNYYTVTAATGQHAQTAYVSASSTMGTDTSLVFLDGATAYLKASPIAAYTGDTATWDFAAPSTVGGTLPTAPSGKTNTYNFTVTGSVTATAKYTTEASYTAKIYFLKNGTAGQYVTSGVTKVDLATAADGTTGARSMSKDSTNGGLWTASVSASSTYSYVTVTVDGATYVVPLTTAIAYTTNEEEDVPLYEVTLKTDTTVPNSATPWGTATVTIGTSATTTKTSTNDGSVTDAEKFFVPSVDNAITLTSTSHEANYVDRATHKWSIDGGANTDKDDGYKFKPAAATTIIAYFTPHGKLKFSPSPITVSKRENYPTQNIVEESTTGKDSKGYLKNEGPADVPGITYSFAVDNTGATWPSGKTPDDFLKLTKSPTDLTKAGGTTDWSGVVVQMLAGLPQNANPYKAKLTISSSDDNVDDVVVEISITINEASGIEFDPAGYTWDTYTETISADGVNAGTDKTWSTVLGLIDLKSVKSIKVGSTTLEEGTGKDYTLSAITQGATADDPDTITVSFTTAGLKKIAGEVTPGSQGALVVTADDNDAGVKVATIPVKLIDTMPKLTNAAFDNVDTSKGNAWKLGSSPAPGLKVTDSNSKTTPSLTGAVTYEWSLNGAVKDSWKNQDNLTAAQLANLNVGDTVTVKATGTGVKWQPQSEAGDGYSNLYKDTVSVTAYFKVALPEVTVKITLDGSDYTAPGSGDKITASSTDLGSGLLLQTDSTNAKKYAFVKWTMADDSTGNFAMSGTVTETISATTPFKPVKAATVVANWKSIATLDYKKGSTATGPDANDTKYTDKLVNNGAATATITGMTLTGTGSDKFTLKPVATNTTVDATKESAAFEITPKTGNDAPVAGVYTLTVTTTYTGGAHTTDTVVQTVVYTVPEPTYTITLTHPTSGGSIIGNYKGETKETASGTNQTFDVTKKDSIALTGKPDKGYKFEGWSVNPAVVDGATTDKFGNAVTDASNAYGGVTQPATITATFKPVTDVKENTTKSSATVNIGYSNVDVFTGKVWNEGALATKVRFELTGVNASDFSITAPSLDSNGDASIAALGSSPANDNVTVRANNNLTAGTYTANLVITEQTTDADDTMSGIKSWTIPLTFTVGGGSAKIEVKLNATNQNNETVTLLAPDGSTISAATPTSGNKYTASGLTTGVAYDVLVNGVKSGETVTVTNVGTAATATVQLWTLSLTPDPSDKSLGDVSASGGTKITVNGGAGYTDGSQVTLTAAPKTGNHFVEWTDKAPAGDANKDPWSSSSNKSSANPATITMKKAMTIEGKFEADTPDTEYVTITYHDNKNSSPISSGSDAVLATVQHVKSTDYKIASLTPTIPGYKFVKWNTLATGAGTSYVGGNTITKLAADLHLYAVWEAVTATWATLPNGTYGTPYNGNAIVTNGNATGPVKYTYTGTKTGGSGTTAAPYLGLPDGLTLAENGTISGKPAETGKFKFTVTATSTEDTNITWTHEYTITIAKAKPTLSGVSFSGVSEGALKANVTANGTVSAPKGAKSGTTITWTDPTTYTYGTTRSDAGTLTVTDPAQLNFNGSTTLDGKVKFTPSATQATGFAGTHQTAQKYSDIYLEVEDPCVFNLGGQTWDVEVDPASKTFGPYNFGDTTTGGAQAFKVTNKGNQDVYLQYVWKDATSDFSLTGTDDYNNTSGSVKSDKLDTTTSGKVIASAFSVEPSLTATKAPGTYTANVAVKVYKDPGCAAKDLVKTILVPVTYTINSTDYDVTVQIDLTPVSGSKETNKKVPNNGAVTFVAADGTTIAGVWDDTDKVYKAKLPGGKSYSVYVNGDDTGKDVAGTDATTKSATVDMYELALDQDGTSNGVQDITSAQSGEGYYLAGKKVTISTPPSCGATSNNYDFEKWVNGGTTVANTNTYEYTMTAAATTLTANYTNRPSDTVIINYHSNYDDTDTVLWTQSVTKNSTVKTSTTKPTRNGYTFVGWNTVAAGTGAGSKSFAANADIQPVDNLTTTPAPVAKEIKVTNGAADLYAQWRKMGQTGDGMGLGDKAKTYYSEHYSTSIAITSWNDGAESNAQAVTAPSVKYKIASGALPGGLTLDENTGVISGRPYEVKNANDNNKNTFTFTVKVVPADDEDGEALYTSGDLTITVGKEPTRLANVRGENAAINSAFSTADYCADVVADILKYKVGDLVDSADRSKVPHDTQNKATVDYWEDGQTIITGGKLATQLHYKGSSDSSYTASTDVKAGGALALKDATEGAKTFAATTNAVALTWTPGDTSVDASGNANTYMLVDGASNSWGDIFKPADGTAYITPGNDTWILGASPANIKFKVTKGGSDYKVYDSSATGTDKYVAIGSGTTADNITLNNTGTQSVYATWALDATTYFSGPATSNATVASGASKADIEAVPSYNSVVGTYVSKVTVTYYDKSGGAKKGEATVTLVLEVVEPTTFSFEVDTWLHAFGDDATATSPATAVAGTVAKGDVTKVELVNAANASDKATLGTRTPGSGEYPFTIDGTKNYKVFVNDVELPGVLVNKTTTSPLKVDLYQLTLTKDSNGSANPTATPAGSTGGYYLPGQRVTVKAAAGNPGYTFKSWSETLENGKDAGDTPIADTPHNDFSTADPLYYVMGTQAVQLKANYKDGTTFKVILDDNGGALTFATVNSALQTSGDVLTGSTVENPKSGNYYIVNNGDKIGVGASVPKPPAAGQFNIERDGYTLVGWSTVKTASTGAYSFTANQAAVDDDGTDGDGVITLYAIWSKNADDLKLAPKVIESTYKHPISPDVEPTVTGGTAASFSSDNDPFPIYTGVVMDTTTGKVSGTPDDVGTKTSVVTVTDTDGREASATYTIVIGKADVVPNGSTPLPTTGTEVTVPADGDVAKAILDALNNVQMDGDGTNEKKINGTWSIDGSVPTTDGTHTVKVTFHPTDATTKDTTKDHDDTKDGKHYNEYPGEVTVVIGGKLITRADLDTGKLMKPVVGDPLKDVTDLRGATSTLTGNSGTPTYAATAGDTDVYISEIQWIGETDSGDAKGGVDYYLDVTLKITDTSGWRFDTASFDGTIAGEDATVIAINNKMAILRVKFPKKIAVIDVNTNTPIHDTDSNAVWVPTSHDKEYTIVEYKWYESTATPNSNNAVGSGSSDSKVKFDKDKYYDLVVTVKPKTGNEFSNAILEKDPADNNKVSMNDCDEDKNDGDTATVNGGRPPVEAGNLTADKRFVVVEAKYTADGGITIRYRAFQPADQTLVGIRVEGTPGVYYAQTGADKNHYDTLNTAATPTADNTGNTGSKDKYLFTFDFSELTVTPLYQKAGEGKEVVAGTPLAPDAYEVYADGKKIPADGFKNGYNSRTDVKDFDGKTLLVKIPGATVSVDGGTTTQDVQSAVAGTLRVRELTASILAKNAANAVLPTLRYEQNDKFTFDKTATRALQVDVTFNALTAAQDPFGKDGDPTELKNEVKGLAYAPYADYAKTPTAPAVDSHTTYFFEYGEDLPTFVPHKTGDPSSLADGLLNASGEWINELLPGTTDMTAAMKDKTLYATYVDVNHNVVRVALGTITFAADFTTKLDDPNGPNAEYGDTLVGTPLKPDGTTPVDDPNNYTYVWEYWKPKTTDPKDKDPNGANAEGTWEPIPTNPANPTGPKETDRTHVPAKEEVGEYIRVVATERGKEDDPKTERPSSPVQVQPRSLNFDVKPWNKAPADSANDHSNIHSYEASDFTLKPTGTHNGLDVGGVYGNDSVTLAPNGSWNNTPNAADKTAVNARPNYRHPDLTNPNTEYWKEDLSGAQGAKITWPAVTEATGDDVNKVGGYTLAGDINATSLNGTAIPSVYRLRAQDEIPDRGTILAVDIIDENEHDPEYGDKLTADPKKPDGTSDDDPNLTYEWEKWVPTDPDDPDTNDPTKPGAQGEWKPIPVDPTKPDGPKETGKTHIPGKDEVDEYIRVVVTDPDDGTKRESAPQEIMARSLNFEVERQDRVHTTDDDAKNTHSYTDADFRLTKVSKDIVLNPDKSIKVDATTKMAEFTATTVPHPYGGIYGNDSVTLAPAPTTVTPTAYTSWNNDTDRPNYRTPTENTTIAASTANGEVDSKIIWPQVFEGNLNKDGAAEKAGQFIDYTLTGPTNTKGAPVYRLVPQDEQLDRGKITGGAGGNVMHVNVDFKNYPTIGGAIPNYPDSEEANADGTGDVAVTDKRETRPGEVLDHANDAHTTVSGTGYPGNQYIAMWYPATATTETDGSTTYAKNFDPTSPGTALNSGNAATDNKNTAFTRPDGKVFDGSAATVVVKVIARKGYAYDLDRDDNKETKFHFKFGTATTVDLTKATTGPQGVLKKTETVGSGADAKNYDVYYMWYTFTPDMFVLPPFEDTPIDLGLTADQFIYYANTDADTPATGDHHHAVNDKADNENNDSAKSIPGGKKDIGFIFEWDDIVEAIDLGDTRGTDHETAGTGTTLKRTDGTTVLLTEATYGDTWRLKAGPRPEAAANELDATVSGSYVGKTFKDTVDLQLNAVTGDNKGKNFGDSQTYDGQYVYIEILTDKNVNGTVTKVSQIYPAPLCVKANGVLTPTALTVKELTAEEISSVTGTATLDYTAGETFASAITAIGVAFNKDAMNVTYPDSTYNANGQDIDWNNTAADGSDAKEGKVFYYQYLNGSTYTDIAVGTALTVDTHNGKPLYICYTDVNNHIVRKLLGALTVKVKPAEGTVSRISITYPEPIKDKKPTSVRTNLTNVWTWNELKDTAEVDVSDTLVTGSTYKAEGTTWFDAGTSPTLSATGLKAVITANDQLTDAFQANHYYMVEGVITKKNLEFDFTNGVLVNINGVPLTVSATGTAYGVKNGAAGDPIGWAMAEKSGDDIKVYYMAKTMDDTLVGSVSINYVTPAVPNATEDYTSYADTQAVTVPNKDAADDPTTWYKVSDTADTAYAEDTTANKLAMGTDYVAGGVYMVVNKVTANTGYKLDANTVVSVDGHKLTGGSYVNPDPDAESGLIKAQATLANGVITVKSIYKVSANKPDAVTDVFATYRQPVAGNKPDDEPIDWGDKDQVNLETLNATDNNTADWYKLGNTVPDWTGGTKMNFDRAESAPDAGDGVVGDAFELETWYRAESIITPDGVSDDHPAGFAFKTTGQTVRIQGITVTVGGDVVEIKDHSNTTIGYVKAEWGKKTINEDGTDKIVDDYTKIKTMYIAKTGDNSNVAVVGINYITPMAGDPAAEYINYVDRNAVRVDQYVAPTPDDPGTADVDESDPGVPDGTRWYPVADGITFTYTAGDMMPIGTTDDAKKYKAGKYYLVENVIHANDGYQLSTNTVVQVDGHAVTADNAVTTITNSKGYGLVAVKKVYNAATGDITVQSIYKVRDEDPGVLFNVAITYPEPKKDKKPVPQGRGDVTTDELWSYQDLSKGVEVDEDPNTDTTDFDKDTVGSTWYTTDLTDATIAGLTATNFTDNAVDANRLKAAFEANKYYLVKGVITPDATHVFDTKDPISVTINGIQVPADGATVGVKYGYVKNDTGDLVIQPVGWAMAETVKDATGKVTQINAYYIAKTEIADSVVIDRVRISVTAPAGGATRSTADLILALLENNELATENVELTDVTWSKSQSYKADGTGYTALAAGDDSGNFVDGNYYKVEFIAKAINGYTFQHKDTTSPADGQDDDFVAFLVNGVTKADKTWVNDKRDPTGLTDVAPAGTDEVLRVMSEQVNADNEYKITVLFPLTGNKKDIPVIGYAEKPESNKTISVDQITVEANRPYEIKVTGGKEEKKWQHWDATANKWVDITATNATFKSGDFYRAVISNVVIKDAEKNNYEFTNDTMGYVNNVSADKANALSDTITPVAGRTTIVHNATGDVVTSVTLAQEFRVARVKTVVEVVSPVPTAGVSGYSIDKDVVIYSAGVGKYTLSDENTHAITNDPLQGSWYAFDAAANKYVPMGTSVFEEGKTYYLITTATAEADYCFYDTENGYKWYEAGTFATKAPSATTLFKDGNPAHWKVENDETVVARVAFEYTIAPPNYIAEIPGNAKQPEYNKPLDDKGWTSENFDVVGKVIWYEGEKKIDEIDSTTPVDYTNAKEEQVYTAAITVKPKDGVNIDPDTGKLIYTFNGERCETNEYRANPDGTYTLVHTFPPTGKKEVEYTGGGGGGGSTTIENPVVYYHLKDQGVTDDPTAEKVRRNSRPTKVPKVKAMTGLKFLGWSEVDPSTLPAGKLPTLVDPTTFKITEDKWFYAVYEQGTEVDHLHYVIGFPNGTFGPDAKITRAEVATIIARACLEGFVEGANYGNPGNYSDVTTHWAFSAIAFCAREGVFKGYEDGTFRPDRYITRQELATVVARLAGVQTSQGVPFNDRDQIASWAMNGIYTAYANGWIKGYEDGTFQPERDISRAETVKIFNGYLKRGVDAKGLEGLKEYVHTGVASNNQENGHDEYMTWPDVPKTHWAYHEIIEAANDHNYHWQDDAKKTPPEDWDEVYIDEKWRYNDNADDGADKRDENMTLQKTFTVTYLVSSNGVTYDAITETVDRFASPKPENMPIAVPNEGYRFVGWSSTDPSTGMITLVDPTASSVTSDEWFYAVFEEDKPVVLPVYTVTYVIGDLGSYDGATVERVEMYQAPSPATLPQPTVSEGYRLAGWSETDPAAGSYTIVDPTANYVTGDKTFYAVYEKADEPYHLPVYTVTYVIGEHGSYDGVTVEQVEMFQAPSLDVYPHPVANEGYRFVGWSETDPADGSYEIMDPTANYVTGDKTFFAVYEAV